MPLKRTEELQPLSRQHHNGLLFCLLLQKGIRKNADPEVMRDFVQHFWYKDLQHHFQLEEQYLDPLKNRYHQLVEPLEQMIREHYDLKSVINEISLNPTHQSIDELRRKLDDHVRFEERQLFPLIEESISPQELQKIGKILEKENDANCMNYSIKFWE
jgi:iron-sulfur cluster repair protein YtfE (RIC family)